MRLAGISLGLPLLPLPKIFRRKTDRPLSSNPHRISLLTATCIVIANMIGTGIFTSLGFQVGDLPSGFAIIALWSVGGICAMCGALSYAELARGAAAVRRGISFSARDLSSVARIFGRVDFGNRWLLRARRDRRDAIRHLSR